MVRAVFKLATKLQVRPPGLTRWRTESILGYPVVALPSNLVLTDRAADDNIYR